LLPFRKDDNEFWLTEISQTPTVHESILEDLDNFPRIMFTFFQIQWLRELHLSPCCIGQSVWTRASTDLE
jgi:hypothetical protein